ncbi:MAG: flagellar type III secretion system pore protein FliP [Spirochaetaceae bacterium]|nr:flagellar type III secretion system pore protein FliP [Spirochaetaceae bacterium]MDT8299624.1 flagellar type III secretion system pore protein FliP [Spirochaetaceae bacterium]
MSRRLAKTVVLVLFFGLAAVTGVYAQADAPAPGEGGQGLGEVQTLPIPFVDLTLREQGSNQETALSIQLLLLLTIISLSPTLIVLMTSFLRIAIVLDFVKRALSLQQVPPNSVLMGIALFLTLFIMFPTFNEVYEEAFVPFSEGELDTRGLYDNAAAPIRYFMYRQMSDNTENITLFMNLTGLAKPETFADVPTYVLVPAFVLHELTVAFRIGIYLYVPFIIIDMVVASVLMSMGMIMLPPVMISMPFKLILFVLVDGWTLLVRQIVMSFS